MTEVKHLIEEWIEMRATLQRQLKMLESGELRVEQTFLTARGRRPSPG